MEEDYLYPVVLDSGLDLMTLGADFSIASESSLNAFGFFLASHSSTQSAANDAILNNSDLVNPDFSLFDFVGTSELLSTTTINIQGVENCRHC